MIRKFMLVPIAAAGLAAALITPADAAGWYYHGLHRGYAWGYPGWGYHGWGYGGGAVAAGAVAGLAVGTAVGVAAARPVYAAPAVVYAPPPVVYAPPAYYVR